MISTNGTNDLSKAADAAVDARPKVTLDEKIKLANELRGIDLRSVTAAEVEEMLTELMKGCEFLFAGRDKRQTWYRARKSLDGENFGSLVDLIYPPKGNRSYGRANLPGTSIMYGGWNVGTALDEIDAEKNDLVNIILFRVRPGILLRCASIGNFNAYYQSGRCLFAFESMTGTIAANYKTDSLEYAINVFVDCILTEFFGRVNATGTYYKLSAVIAHLFLKSGKIGLIFPSVKVAHGQNLAISANVFDQAFEVVGAESSQIAKVLGFGLYEFRKTIRSTEFLEEGTIVWDSKKVRLASHSMRGGTVLDDTPGWRTPP